MNPPSTPRRWYAFGYRSTDAGLNMPPLMPPDESTKIHIGNRADCSRPVVRVCCGPFWSCGGMPLIMPQPDFRDLDTAVEGVEKRFACQVPVAEPDLISKLKKFVAEWLKKNMTPLDAGADDSFETWLEKTNFPRWRKRELQKAKERLDTTGWKSSYAHVKSFIKRETYPEPKYARPINSRSDPFKVFCAPIFKLIEEQLFALDPFIKKIPVAERPAYIVSQLLNPGCVYASSDYTSFEALFTVEIMEAVEFQLYEYMSKNLPNGPSWLHRIRCVLLGKNRCFFSGFRVTTRGRRMSGEMCTSLGNSFSNLMFMLFMASLKGFEVVGSVVEGDDGLFAIRGELPTPQDFERLGLRIKMESHEELSTASFCGLIFDPKDCVNIREPRNIMADFAWVESRYAGARQTGLLDLMRCKALSLAHQYPGCPIVSHLARYGLRMTEGRQVKELATESHAFGTWERDQFREIIGKEVPWRDPPMATRLLFEKQFNVSVEQQLRIETLFDTKTDLAPFRCDLDVHPSWIHQGLDYAIPLDRLGPLVYPGPSRSHAFRR